MKQYKGNTDRCPIKEGEIIDLECISIGKKGDGIFKIEGFVVVAPDTEVGKTYKLKMTKVLPTIGFAEVMQNDVGEDKDVK